jgi:thiamine-phosphate pyrophosphorylase
LILDREVAGKRKMNVLLREAIRGGIDMVQYRDKTSSCKDMIQEARKLLKIARKHSILFVINDNCEVAKSIDADGVHIGQDDVSPAVARAILGTKKIIGYSCHNLKDLKSAQKDTVDYYGFGPVFATKTKPQVHAKGKKRLQEFLKNAKKPVFAIGGITEKNLIQFENIKNIQFAICRDICRAKNIQEKVKKIKDGLTHVSGIKESCKK